MKEENNHVGESNKKKVLSFFGKGGVNGKKVKELSHDWKKWTKKLTKLY